MNILIILNDAPYGTEKAYNALRLANQILKDYPEKHIEIFLLADSVGCGLANQKTPDGYYNIGRMIKFFVAKGGIIKTCGACMDARGITEEMFQEGVQRSTLKEFARLTAEYDKALTF
ncbi:MAG: DsrE family protein [Bacteroidales bacterium]|nr:DsrE family protein [Bacteroidales bacterium]